MKTNELENLDSIYEKVHKEEVEKEKQRKDEQEKEEKIFYLLDRFICPSCGGKLTRYPVFYERYKVLGIRKYGVIQGCYDLKCLNCGYSKDRYLPYLNKI